MVFPKKKETSMGQRDQYDFLPDSETIHRWDGDEQECPVIGPKIDVHKHFMLCTRCGTRRHGAFAEQGCYHYFTHDHPNFDHEAVPPPRLNFYGCFYPYK